MLFGDLGEGAPCEIGHGRVHLGAVGQVGGERHLVRARARMEATRTEQGVRTALQDAASVAGLILTTDATVAEATVMRRTVGLRSCGESLHYGRCAGEFQLS